MGSVDRKIIKWRDDVLPRITKRALTKLAGTEWLKRSSWYLAGGTALALQVGHRQSVDLDFFSPKRSADMSRVISYFPSDSWKTDILREGTLYGRFLGAKVSFIVCPFFKPAEKTIHYGAVRVLDLHDIAVMKIITISQRGRKRDFVDLYWYLHNSESLLEVIHRLPKQYPTVAHDYHHILKSLMYFEDAEADPMPKLFFTADWRAIKLYFRREIPKITKEILKLRYK